MKNTFSKYMTLTLAFAVFLATVICCNPAQTGSLFAMLKKNSKVSLCAHCRAGKSNQDNKSCCFKKLEGEVLGKDSLVKAQHFSSIIKDFESLVFSISRISSKFNVAFLHGPPGKEFSTPL